MEAKLKRVTTCIGLVGTLLGLTTSPLQAALQSGDVIRVDFGATAPVTNYYNVINSSTLSIADLVRFSDGSALGVGLTVTASNPFDNAANVASASGLSDIDTTDATVYEDGFLSTNGNNGAGNDIITLTFTGLDDSLYYDLSAALARSANGGNFSTTWSIPGADTQTSDGTTTNGYVYFNSLTSSGGTLTITLTDTLRQSGLAQLALAVTNTPPPEPPTPPTPELPASDVAVYFGPTEANSLTDFDDLDAVTIGANWGGSLASLNRFDATNTLLGDFVYVMEDSSFEGSYIELAIDDAGIDFASNAIAINFDMLATRASASGDKHTTLIGYDGSTEIFRLKYQSHSSNTSNLITASTAEGDLAMGYTPLRYINPTSAPSGLQDFRIVLSGDQVAFSGSSLTPQSGTILNSASTLTSLRWEITGSSTDTQGFWLNDLQIRDAVPAASRAATDRPNVIFILMDDMGYSDISCYGATRVETTNLDTLATEGMQFTDFLLPSNVCSPSRAAFLTGAYPSRCGIPMAVNHPNENHWFLGLDPDEITIAEQCKNQGYKTSMIGKWHLGVEPIFLPYNQGFDHYYGTHGNGGSLYNESDIESSTFPQATLSARYNKRMREHIRANHHRPFFIYYSHNYPHTPYTEGNVFDGATGNGERSDVIKEVDWAIGQMVAELEANGILENTLIVFTSDNGAVPPASYGNAPFRGSKYVTWEGGHRVPFIMYWKGQTPETPSAETLATQVWAMDLFPTVSELIGESLDTNRVYDGTSLTPLFTNQAIARDEDAVFYYYNGDNLQCVRKGDWKLHLPRTEYQLPWWDQIKPPPSDYQLYDLSTDQDESDDVSASHPDIVSELTALADAIRLELGDADASTGALIMGTGQRGTGTLFPEVPTILNLNSDYNYVPDWNSLSDAEKGRGGTLFGATGVSMGGNYLDGTTLPANWEYLYASEASGGSEVALSPNSVVGTEANIGFLGFGDTPAGLIGNASVGSFVIDSGNSANSAAEGTDLLVQPDEDPSRDYVIVRYTIDPYDVAYGNNLASITGSFRDLVGGTSDDSVVVHVFHNQEQLFIATGSDGRLLQADGTFNLNDVTVAAGDTISFVVGSNGSQEGDEVALNASLQFSVSAEAADHAPDLQLTHFSGFGTASLQLEGTPGQHYRIQKSTDLGISDDWQEVENIPFLNQSPTVIDMEVDSADDRAFWRVQLEE